ncbi:MAG: hypothetical protein ACYS1A_01335 [Planctomycetota bacterium]
MTEHRTDEQESGVSTRKSRTGVFEERLKLKTKGDIYHPDLLFYSAALGFGLTQQSVNSDEESGSNDATLNSYNFFGQLLRKKPYPLNFYANKSEYLIARRFLGSLRTETENSGVLLALRSKEWPMTFQYNISEILQDSVASMSRDFFSRDTEEFRYSVKHDFSELSHLRFDFTRSDVSQKTVASLTKTQSDSYSVSHDLTFGNDEQYRLDSFYSMLDQRGTFPFETTLWQERLSAQHSPNFQSYYDFRFRDSEQDTFSDRETRNEAGFQHTLYESLITTGDIFYSDSQFSDNTKLTEYGGNLELNYQKKNRWGTLFSTYSVWISEREQSGSGGTGIVINESHTVPAGAAPMVDLDKTNVDVSSIEVRNSKVGGLEFDRDLDYRVIQLGGKVHLELIMNEGSAPDFTAVGQEFFVTYNFFIEPQRQENILRQSFTVRERFNSGLSLYYAHQRQDQDVSSNTTDITPDESVVNTYGVDYLKGGLTLLAEYSEEDSTLISSTSQRLEARYSWRMSDDIRASLRVSNHWLSFTQPQTRDIALFNASGTLNSILSDKYNLATSVNYRDEDDTRFGATEGFDLRSELKYNYRQLNVIAGVEYDLLDRRGNQSNSTFFYLRIKRFF